MNKVAAFVAGIVAIVIVLLIGMVGGVVLDRQVLQQALPSTNNDIGPEDAENFALMAEAWNMIQEVYVGRDEIDHQDLTYGAISGMVDSLGDTGHSRFMDPEMVQAEQQGLSGEFEGIGVTVEIRDDNITVVSPFDGSPAQQAGIKAGDVILEADGFPLTGVPLSEAITHILGPAGTPVKLTIFDPETGEVREVEVIRAKIQIKNVTWSQIPGTKLAHLRVVVFAERVGEDLTLAMEEIQAQGMEGVVLDLRNNPGGFLGEAIEIASQFLPDGNVLLVRDAEGNIQEEEVIPGGIATGIPMVVLINEGSASASEIVSGALQDSERATLIGMTTFGTGTVLNQFNLSDGSALLLATQEWLTPSGRVIWHQGIEPDIVVEQSLAVLPVTTEQLSDLTLEEIEAGEDQQFWRAIQELQSQLQ